MCIEWDKQTYFTNFVKEDEDWGEVIEKKSSGLFRFIAKMEVPYNVEHETVETVVQLMNTFSMVRFIASEKKDALLDAMRSVVKGYQERGQDGKITLSYNVKFYLYQRVQNE